MDQKICPELPHFHIVYEQVGSIKRPTKVVVAATAEDALAAFLPTLPKSWTGGVSVFDDSNVHEDEMPLLHRYVTKSYQLGADLYQVAQLESQFCLTPNLIPRIWKIDGSSWISRRS